MKCEVCRSETSHTIGIPACSECRQSILNQGEPITPEPCQECEKKQKTIDRLMATITEMVKLASDAKVKTWAEKSGRARR